MTTKNYITNYIISLLIKLSLCNEIQFIKIKRIPKSERRGLWFSPYQSPDYKFHFHQKQKSFSQFP